MCNCLLTCTEFGSAKCLVVDIHHYLNGKFFCCFSASVANFVFFHSCCTGLKGGFADLDRNDSQSSNEPTSDSAEHDRHFSKPSYHNIGEDDVKSKVPNSNDSVGQQPQQGMKSLLETLEWRECGEQMLGGESSDDDDFSKVRSATTDSFDADFAAFSAERTTTGKPENPRSHDSRQIGSAGEYDGIRVSSDNTDVDMYDNSFTDFATASDWSNKVETGDLLGGGAAEWNAFENSANLLDIGQTDTSNFDLLVDSSVPIASSDSTQNLQGESLNPFRRDDTMQPTMTSQSSDKLFDFFSPPEQTTTNTSQNASSSLFDSFDPFLGTPIVHSKQPTETPRQQNAGEKTPPEDDFLAFLESKPLPNGAGNPSDDLIGDWNASNIASGANLSMPRPNSRTDLSGQTLAGQASISRNHSAHSMTAGPKLDPFGDLGQCPFFLFIHLCRY